MTTDQVSTFLALLAVVAELGRPHSPDAWLARGGWTSPVLVDADGAAAEAAGLSPYPYFVAIGADGKVAARTSGELTTDQLDAFANEIAG